MRSLKLPSHFYIMKQCELFDCRYSSKWTTFYPFNTSMLYFSRFAHSYLQFLLLSYLVYAVLWFLEIIFTAYYLGLPSFLQVYTFEQAPQPFTSCKLMMYSPTFLCLSIFIITKLWKEFGDNRGLQITTDKEYLNQIMAKVKQIPKSSPTQPNTSLPITPQQPSTHSPVLSFENVSGSIVSMILSVLKIINTALMLITYCLLIFQTVYVLNSKQPKYINLRHIALKWLACIFLYIVKQGFVDNVDVNSQMVIILLNLITIAIAYPSKALKLIHLKYFSHKEQQRYNQSVTDPNQYDITFSSKVCIAVTVFLLNMSKHLVALVLPQHRRPIEDALRALNGLVIDRKCFWSIYSNGTQQQVLFEKDKIAIKEYLVSGSALSLNPNNPMLGSGTSPTHPPPTNLKEGKDVVKAYGQKCSNLIANGFKPIKRVSIKYMVYESKLQILDLDFAKVETYILQQLIEREGNVLEFTVLSPGQKNSEPLFIKFKSARELEVFMKSIQESQKAF